MLVKKKKTQEELVVELLKKGWFTNFGMQQKLKSSSADRAFRKARERGLAEKYFRLFLSPAGIGIAFVEKIAVSGVCAGCVFYLARRGM